MIKRLTQRRKLVIGGCIFAAVVLGVACSAPAHAASFEVSMDATSDSVLSGSSDWSWAASDGDLSKTPPLGIGQEIIRGGYSGSLLVVGPGTMSSERSLSSGDILEFSTNQDVDTQGPGILTESLTVDSCGSPSAGVTCGSDSLDAEGANFTRTAYCEHAGTSGLFMTNSLAYSSSGGISQGDIDQPDSLRMEMNATGNGYGSFAAASRSLIGIGGTSGLGYTHVGHDDRSVGGKFTLNSKVHWSSFV